MNNTRFLPRRWFAPREAAPRRDDLPVTPVRDDIDLSLIHISEPTRRS